MAELERSIIKERVVVGLDRAKRQGKRLGRPGTCVSARICQYEIYVDGEYVDYFASATAWDDAATFIENNTPTNTPLRLLAELGETHRPEEAGAMLSDLLEYEKPAPDIEEILRHLHRFLTGDHVLITDGEI